MHLSFGRSRLTGVLVEEEIRTERRQRAHVQRKGPVKRQEEGHLQDKERVAEESSPGSTLTCGFQLSEL